jgi:membrane-associated protein
VTLARLTEWLDVVVVRTGPYAPLVLFGASFLEYVFPPFPGDALVLLGAWYAVHGDISWPLAFAAVTAGALIGAVVDWRVGRALGTHLGERFAARAHLAEKLARFQASYRRWGPWLLVANRFMPGVRALFFVVAGASGVPLSRVLVFGGISAAAWNALLLLAGAFVARNVDELSGLMSRYTSIAWVIVAAVLAAIAGRFVWKRRRARAAPTS